MKIFVITSIYPSKYASKGTTPVVHYFAREWVKMGHKVQVFHTESGFPRFFYFASRFIKKVLDTRQGYVVPTVMPKEYSEEVDGVSVNHLVLKKHKPHSRFPSKELSRVIKVISSSFGSSGVPDCIVGHWDNPALELLYSLKKEYNVPTCLVFHDNNLFRLADFYGKDFYTMTAALDLVGFRNQTAKNSYFKLIGKSTHSFIAASGVSSPFLEAGKGKGKTFERVDHFIYVGTLISRKYPTEIVEALSKSFGEDPFNMTYIGEGEERHHIEQTYEHLSCKGSLSFTGRIPREEVIQYLNAAEVFIMISKREVFGLVYLEAMALGCITIASRNQGIDGIIEDGVNGFLCEAGNADELAVIISKIRRMTPAELSAISARAKQTARAYSDIAVASSYLNELKGITH